MNPAELPPLHLIDTQEELAAALVEWRRAGRLALDTESNSLYAYHYQICLIQISAGGRDYLIDTLALPDQRLLSALVADASVEVTMHAAENDILLLNRDFGFIFGRVFDTLWGARILGWPRAGLASILKQRFDVKADKGMQRTNWGQRPLTPRQMEYARMDTHFLLELRDQQEEELRRRGRWQEAQEVFAELLSIRWEEKEAPTLWRLSGVHDLEPQEQAVLAALFDWREHNASTRDVPSFKVLRNEVLMNLAQAQPGNESDLRQVQGIPRRLPRHVARQLLETIARGRQAPPPEPPPRNHSARPDDDVLARYDRLRAWRIATAKKRGVDVDVVLTNQVLMAIAREQPSSLPALSNLGVLGPWKLATYGPDILRICQR